MFGVLFYFAVLYSFIKSIPRVLQAIDYLTASCDRHRANKRRATHIK